jgi:hypothetical protein
LNGCRSKAQKFFNRAFDIVALQAANAAREKVQRESCVGGDGWSDLVVGFSHFSGKP